jgi:hypothetical protein
MFSAKTAILHRPELEDSAAKRRCCEAIVRQNAEKGSVGICFVVRHQWPRIQALICMHFGLLVAS